MDARSNPIASAPMISLDNVTVSSWQHPERSVLQGVNWKVQRGDFWIVAGLHGAGKTALLSTAAGLQRPRAGTVRWFGKSVEELSEAELIELRRKIGIVFEQGRMIRGLTVFENVALPLSYHSNHTSEVEARVQELLALTGMEETGFQTVGTLNAVCQQRIGLARALALQPELLLIDRPLLVAGAVRWWTEFLKVLHAGHPTMGGKPVTIVLATDDFSLWQPIGRQVAFIKLKKFAIATEAERADLERQVLREELWRDED